MVHSLCTVYTFFSKHKTEKNRYLFVLECSKELIVYDAPKGFCAFLSQCRDVLNPNECFFVVCVGRRASSERGVFTVNAHQATHCKGT